MPLYTQVEELPTEVRDQLPEPALEIYLEAFNDAWKQYEKMQDLYVGTNPEETAHRMAWAAVKVGYERDKKSGDWHIKTN